MKLLLILSFTLLFSCDGAPEMSITIYSNCADLEATEDLDRSIDKNKEHFENNDITLRISDDNKCGYLLRYKDEEKFIQGAMTDIDLLQEVEKFFDIRILPKE